MNLRFLRNYCSNPELFLCGLTLQMNDSQGMWGKMILKILGHVGIIPSLHPYPTWFSFIMGGRRVSVAGLNRGKG